MEDTVEILSPFERLANVDVSDYVAQKGDFNYLSWAFAIGELGKVCPDAVWETKRFPLLSQPEILVPYMETPLGYFVEVEVIIDGLSRSQILPVLNYKNKPIEKPSTFDVNTSIQRCLVKAIGLHGLGLNVYAGEDVPIVRYTAEQRNELYGILDDKDALSMAVFMRGLPPETQIELFNSFPKGEKTRMKKEVRDLEKEGISMISKYAFDIVEHANNDDSHGVIECVEEMGEEAKHLVWQQIPEELQDKIKALLTENE